MQAWYMPGEVTDQRAPNKLEPNEPVDLDTLASYGVLYWKLSGAADDEELLKIKTERGYDYSDNITCSPEKLPNYEEKCVGKAGTRQPTTASMGAPPAAGWAQDQVFL